MVESKQAFKVKLGKRIAQIRIEQGLTQEKLGALYLAKSQDKQTISRLETEGANPTAYNLVQLAAALNVSLDELVDFTKLEV
ncbi:helix-turn-helix domain-containing protein [Mucilaginibacter sp. NFX135]|uniref:helix-turn-helix domain-containing protein n=1 Tax=Mucilaginibacter sp. NFX135 TaxID=3402687 RepID=UPI003AFA667D